MVERRSGGTSKRRGSVLLVALIAVMVVAALASAMLIGGSSRDRARDFSLDEARALYVAEAGMSVAIAAATGGVLTNVGSEGSPVAFGGGEHWVTAVDNGDDTATITAWGSVGGAVRCTQAILESDGAGIYDYAVYAGNSGGDPGYDMTFGGRGGDADQIRGKIYSGGNVVIRDDARISGGVEATGTVSGGSFGPHDAPQTGVRVPPPDLRAMDYEHNHDFDVASMFAGATWSSSPLGGSAWQMPESSPAHIFRRNPSDRTTENASTAKDDYYLEDPYVAVSTSSVVSPGAGTPITLSGLGGSPGPTSTDKVFYVDGNLWVHNRSIYSFTFSNTGSEQIQITIVVKGNVYFSDNILYQGTRQDGIAFIALSDSSVADSGNIYFGDPTFGTLERMDAFMYAENDFFDNNLSATGSARVVVNGNMTAGNQVRINRDFGDRHSKLIVNYDNRIANSDISLPGLPSMHYGSSAWTLRVWRELASAR